jgi:glutamine amidotransferase
VIAIADYGMGNRRSVEKALAHVGAESVVTDDVRNASAIILPGVGAFPEAMRNLERSGLGEQLVERAAAGVPLLGICLGMQLLFEGSEEGDTACLGLLPGRVRRLRRTPGRRVPHMGWNRLRARGASRLAAGLDGEYAYFVHGFAAPADAEFAAADSEHGEPFAAIVERGRLCGAQFHPERSAQAGARLLRNFLEMGA